MSFGIDKCAAFAMKKGKRGSGKESTKVMELG